ncbi:glycosyltransferase family protein [Novosphingobium aerophilum]|uniref:Exov-like protein n=1 Tax=Novosphingobium aerophilum TaxID=2839843 RepID=A0A7X1F9D9_9SPHN|nr:exov-like protein [Novosphingobium aerophilum]MBC2652842.1 exov-like protein [Novosphingobium aerophilum]
MRVFYYAVTSNFGDHMNSWLWPRLIPELLAQKSNDVLIGIGSLIQADVGKLQGNKIVFGTGSGYGPMPLPSEVRDWRVYCVRGPLSARMLGLPAEKAVVDGAWLVDSLPEFRFRERERRGTVFVPHWTTDLYANWRQPCREAGIRYVSPFLDGAAVLDSIAGAELAIVESLHGAIMADYYRVPWIPVATGERVLSFKWLDFCLSLGLRFRPIHLPITDSIERAIVPAPEDEWSSGVRYMPEAVEADFAEVPRARHTPVSWQYRMKVKAKALARPARTGAWRAINALRETAPLRAAFRPRSQALADLLQAIAQEPSLLSSDSLRERKLEQLTQCLEQFRSDFGVRS